jgi:hypothetical protein
MDELDGGGEMRTSCFVGTVAVVVCLLCALGFVLWASCFVPRARWYCLARRPPWYGCAHVTCCCTVYIHSYSVPVSLSALGLGSFAHCT